MEMPTIQDIFYCMCDEKITSPELEDLENSFKRVLKIMIERKSSVQPQIELPNLNPT